MNKLEQIKKIGEERKLYGLTVITVSEDFDLWNFKDRKYTKIRKYLIKIKNDIKKLKKKGYPIPNKIIIEILKCE